ncbi:MAG: cation:proton antiporter [Solirubrobacterales bacterium]|nr:cation:proton antiporter [Solirubrobacterales bacterium]
MAEAENLLLIALIAVLAPIIADLTPAIRLPVVVAEVAIGIVVGPSVLDLVGTDVLIETLAVFGLAFLFFLAGLELDFERIGGRPLRLGAAGWVFSLALGMTIALLLGMTGVIDSPVLVGLALTTTALGTLMPILRDAGVLADDAGPFVVAAGAAGEFLPLVGLSVIVAIESGEPWKSALLLAFGLIALATAAIAVGAQPRRIVRLVGTTMHSSAQLAVRLAVLLLVALVALAADLGLDLVLGAFTAGLIAGLVVKGDEHAAAELRSKLEAVGFGFLVPIFFITTGIDFDLDLLLADPAALALVPGFAVLFLAVRGAPVYLLYRSRDLSPGERPSLALFSAAALPLLIAITALGVETGAMSKSEALSLVGAGMLSVMLFPILAMALRPRPPEDGVAD